VTILKNPCIFQSSGRSPGTIRPLSKPFSHFIFYRAGRLEQLDHLKKNKKKQKSKKKKFKTNQSKKKRKEKKEKEEKRKGFHNYSFLQNLLYKVKRK